MKAVSSESIVFSRSQFSPVSLMQSWLSRLKVSERITIGFSLALGLSFVGTGVGIIIGNIYQARALALESYVREEIDLLSQLQTGVLQSRTHQQQLIPLSEFPDDFQEEYSHILKHATTIRSVLSEIDRFIQEESIQVHQSNTADTLRIISFLDTYRETPAAYLEELNRLVSSINPRRLSTPKDVLAAQQKLLKFTNSDLAITFDGVSDELVGIIQSAHKQLKVARQEVEAAQQLRNRILVLSIVLSSGSAALLAFIISYSISKPLEAMEKTALRITRNDNFDLRATVIGNDEVSTVAASLNLLLDRVESLLIEQRTRTKELTHINETLVSTRSQMVAQEKLASLGALTAGIAHEIKNPLNFVNNFSELSVELADELKEELDTQRDHLDSDAFTEIAEIVDTLKDNLSKIDRHGKRADKIVANMLMHSRTGDVTWASVDINALVSEAINLAYHGMRAKNSAFNLEFDTDYDEKVNAIYACPQDLNRVFLNIAHNACYAIYQRQLTEDETFIPLLKVRTRGNGETVEIYIRDNGIGMPPHIKDKIFDQFFTTKPAGEGTGLGLSLSHDIIVEQHKGTMTVASEVGVYTDFIITLPRKKADHSPSQYTDTQTNQWKV